jgi:DNA-binding SARP family transcriptional activator
MDFQLLGPVQARAAGLPLGVGGPRQRAVLALLLLHANRVVSSDRLIDDVWGERPPLTAASTLASYVSRLRRVLGAEVLVSASAGYELRVPPERIDVLRFRALAEDGRAHLARGEPHEAVAALGEALSLWRGEPFGDLAYAEWASREAGALRELRTGAIEDRLDAELALGRHAEAIGELELLVLRHPLRERLRGQLMLALYRSGRQAEALETYRQGRRALVDELGLNPGRALQELEQAILSQDSALDLAPAAATERASTLVGRDRELARLEEALDSALAGRGSLVVLTGDPGIGKTRLAEELASLARRSGALVVWGRCWEAGGAPPYWPWTQVLRTYLTGVDHDALRRRLGPRLPTLTSALPALRRLYPELASNGGDVPDDRFVVFSAAAEFFQREAHERPLVIVLDDLHAADDPSLLLLRFISGEVSSWPMLIAALARDDDPGSETQALLADLAGRAQVAIGLRGLGQEAVSVMIAREIGRKPSEGLIRTIHSDTGGNPLFVAEVARVIPDEDSPNAADREPTQFPTGLRDALRRRLGGLSEDCRGVLVHASVIGHEFDIPMLARVVRRAPAELLDPLDEAVRAGAISDVPDALGRFRFAHALMRESLYRDLTAAQRIRLHQHVGEVLEELYAGTGDTHLGELAHHFFQAAPAGQAVRAATYAERAAERALEGLAFEEAARLYRLALRALDLAGRSEPRRFADDLLGLGEAQARAGDGVDARATFLRVAELARAADLQDQLGLAAVGLGGRLVEGRESADPELVPLLEEALSGVGGEDSSLQARLLARLAGALRDQPDREPRNSLSAQAVEIARRVGDRSTLSYALEARWGAIWWIENAAQRLAIADELVELASRSRDRERTFEAHLNRASSLYELGRLREAEAAFELARNTADRLGQPAQHWIVAEHAAMRALAQGRFLDAETLIDQALRIGAASVPAEAVVGHRMQLFLLRREQGRLAEIEQQLAAAAVEHHARWPLRCLLAHLYAALGRTDDARRALSELGDGDLASLPRDNEWLFALSFLPEVCASADDLARAEQLYCLLTPFADRIACDVDDGDSGSVHRPLGLLATLLGGGADATAHLEAAIAHNDALGHRPWAAWSRLALSDVLDHDDNPRAQALRRHARAAAEELGMTELARRATPGRETEAFGPPSS